MTGKLAGKVAVITAGASGIGLATAQCFAAEDARVFITGRREAELQAAAELIGRGVSALRADCSDLADLDRLYAHVKERAGKIDVLFANAGGGATAALGTLSERQYENVFGRHVKGVLFTVQKALPLLTHGASVILTDSATEHLGMPPLSVYAASKAAVRNFASSWTHDLEARGIRVHVLSPGASAAPGLLGLMGNPDPDTQQALLAALPHDSPLSWSGNMNELARAALVLASHSAERETGSRGGRNN
jgi:NAD(P)-dependent dehydrogenase (short-subunit alcohol dehydrogenase family)